MFNESISYKIRKHLIRFYWWCEAMLENTPFRTRSNIAYEPISTATLISLIIAGASFGTNLLLTYLNRPKPVRQVTGKLTGSFTLMDSIWGAPVARIYGGSPGDGTPGGVECGTNIIWMSDIRKTETQTPSGTGGGGGKGHPSPPPNITISYQVDIAGLVGMGKLRLLRMKFNEDIVFSNFGSTNPAGTGGSRIEAEAVTNTLAGGASVASDVHCSGGHKVIGIGSGGSLTFNVTNSFDVDPGGTALRPIDPGNQRQFFHFSIKYKCASDRTAYVVFNGTGGIYTFPATGSTPATKDIVRAASGLTDDFTIVINNPDAAAPDIDCIDIWVETVLGGGVGGDVDTLNTGILDEAFPGERPQDNMLLPDPYAIDTQAAERFNLPAPADAEYTEIALAGGASLGWYQGTMTQPVDAVMEAQITSVYGAGSTPAYLGYSIFRVQNLDFTKYGSVPQIVVVVENIDTQTVSEILLVEALSVNLTEDDLDLTVGDDRHVRGYYVNDATAPAQICEDLGYIHNLTFTETHDGVIKAIDLNDSTVIAELTSDDLGAYVVGEEDQPPIDDVISTVPEESEDLIRVLELQFNNPLAPSDYNTDHAAYNFPFTQSQKKESKSLNATLLPDEAAKIIRRDLQIRHLKQTPDQIIVPHKWAWLNAGDVIRVPIGGASSKRRIEEKTGSAPGTYELSLTNEDLYVFADDVIVEDDSSGAQTPVGNGLPGYPANTVGTIMDIPPIQDRDTGIPGIYIAACSKGQGQWKGCQAMRYRGSGYEAVAALTKQASMGVTVDVLADLPDEGAPPSIYGPTARSVTVDFYGDFNPTTVTDDQAGDGANAYCIGNEVVIAKTWTRVTLGGFANRWQATVDYSGIRNSYPFARDHAIGERVVFLNDAVKFVPIDKSEVGITRDWKFVTYGADVAAAAVISFTFEANSVAPMVETISASRPLDASESEKYFLVDTTVPSAEISLTLPPAAACIAGDTRYRIQDTGSYGAKLIVNDTGSESINWNGLDGGSVTAITGTSVTIPSGMTVDIIYQKDGKWVVLGGPIVNPPTLTSAVFSTPNVNLVFAANGGTGTMRIWRRRGTGAFTDIHDVAYTVTSWSDNTLTADGTYDYMMTEDGVSGQSAIISVVVTGLGSGSGSALPPSGLDGFYDDGASEVDLSWVDNGGTGTFTVERKLGLSGTYAAIITGLSATSTADSTVAGGIHPKTYYYRVKKTGVAGYSNEVAVSVATFGGP